MDSPVSNPGPAAASARPVLRTLKRLTWVVVSLAGIAGLLYLDGLLGEHMESPLAGDSLSYGLLFLAGLFTGFHCVGMCGALVVSYTVNVAKQSRVSYGSHLWYGCGKTLSYTVIGALFGGLGAIVTFTPHMRGVAGIVAGIFLVIFGLSLLNIFAVLNRFRIRTPGFLMRFIGKGIRRHSHPFVIGLLNGLMIICGPLQAMYVMAAGTGSPVQGGTMLFVFGLGTLPVMLGFGALTSALSANVVPRLVKASGFIVIALGAIMLNRGLVMTASGYDFHSVTSHLLREGAPPKGEVEPAGYQVIRMKVTAKGFEPDHFNLVKGVPVRWIIDGQELNYCNHRIVVPALGLEFDVNKGENRIEFTPQQVGMISWSCWMGMIPGVFLVHDAPPPAAEAGVPTVREEQTEAPLRRQFRDWLEGFRRWAQP